MKRPVVLLCVGVVLLGSMPALGTPTERRLPPDKALKAKVDQHVVKGSFRAVLVDLASQAGLTFRVDWKALAKAGVTDRTPVSVNLEKVTWRQVLEVILSRLGRSGEPLGWRIDGPDVVVSTHRRILEMERGAKVAAASLDAKRSVRPTKSSGRTLPVRGLPEIKFNDLPFRDVMGFFKNVTKANFHINWRAIEQEGIDPRTPISLDLRGVSIGRAMDLVFSQVNADRDKFSSVYWVVNNGVVLVSTGNALNRQLITKVIDAGGALLVQPDAIGPRIDFGQATEDIRDASGSTGGGQGIFEDPEEQGRNDQQKSYAEQKKEQADKIIEAIKSAIGPDLWDPEGKGSIRIINNKLVITQTLLGFKLLEKSLR